MPPFHGRGAHKSGTSPKRSGSGAPRRLRRALKMAKSMLPVDPTRMFYLKYRREAARARRFGASIVHHGKLFRASRVVSRYHVLRTVSEQSGRARGLPGRCEETGVDNSERSSHRENRDRGRRGRRGVASTALPGHGHHPAGRRDHGEVFFFKQKTAYEISACLVGSEMCIRDSLLLIVSCL